MARPQTLCVKMRSSLSLVVSMTMPDSETVAAMMSAMRA